MTERLWIGCMVVVSLFMGSCNLNDSAPSERILYTINTFEKDEEGWVEGFAEYPEGLEDSMRLSFDYGSYSPNEEIGNVTAIIQSGFATNNDLFMFIKKQMSGLEPNVTYTLVFDIELMARLRQIYSGDLVREDVGAFLKAGAFTEEPVLFIEDDENLGLNVVTPGFDVGLAHEDGEDLVNMGKLEHTQPAMNPIVLYGYSEDKPVNVRADAEGKVWLLIGVDTNVPLYQSVYYSRITVSYQKLNSPI